MAVFFSKIEGRGSGPHWPSHLHPPVTWDRPRTSLLLLHDIFVFEASAVSENGLLSDSCVSGHRTQANYSGREHHTREAEYSPLRPHGKHVGWFPSGDTARARLRTEEFARASFPLWQVACGGETVRRNFLSPNVHLPSDLTAALWSLLESISH